MVSAAIDSGALRHNLRQVRQWAPKSRVMAVIKANAYGHGLVTVARALGSADAFAVARVDEGLTLRGAGIMTRTVLLEGVFDAAQLAAAAAAGFELVVHTREQLELLRAAPAGARFTVWLKLDSGMNRLGFKGADFGAAYAALGAVAAVQQPVNLFTHLSSADDPERAATPGQLARFAAATESLPGERSIANSAGMLSYREAQADWVRPGLLLYGASPFFGSVGADYGLKPAMTLRSQVIALKDLEAGERVGYGDGYPRSLASGAPVLVNGERVPLAGRVSMDMIGIDVTDLQAQPALGDPVILWGEGLAVEELAVWADTIPYELLCGISQRVAVDLR